MDVDYSALPQPWETAFPEEEENKRRLGLNIPALLGPLASLKSQPPYPEQPNGAYAIPLATPPVAPTKLAVAPKPPSLADQYAEVSRQRPDPNDPNLQTHGWRKGLGLALAGVAGGFEHNPQLTDQLADSVLHGKFNRAEQQWESRLKGIQTQGALADTESQMQERQAKAELDRYKAEHPTDPKENPPETQTYDALIAAGMSPADALEQVKGAGKQDKTPPKQNDFEQFYGQWLKDNKQTDTSANRLKARQQWESAGQKETEGSWTPLYDDKGNVSGAWNAKTGDVRQSPKSLPGKTSQGQAISSKADAAMEKKTAPLKSVVDEATKAAELKDMADKGNAEADVDLVLTFFKTMRSATQGGSGIRFTQQENNLIMGARNLWGGLEVRGNKIFSNGEPLSPTQRQQILDVINIHKSAAQRELNGLQSGSNAGSNNNTQNDPLKIR